MATILPLIAAAVLAVAIAVGYGLFFFQHPYQIIDRSSVANINEVQTIALDLNLLIDFSQRKLVGSITHTFESLISGISLIHLDAEHLQIHSVQNLDTGKTLSFTLQNWPWITDEEKQVLTIDLGQKMNIGETVKIQIQYNTLPEGLGLNWLNEKQTDSGTEFFYTDCQTYYCRSVAPLQDTPAVKAPYTAKVRVKKPLIALMSGVLQNTQEQEKYTEFTFEQKVPVPSYLIAVLGGNLKKKQIDHRTFVYAEPGLIQRSSEVLSDIGTFLDIIERDLVPYRWGDYSIVVMPFGYPNGGMENPQITFMSPSVIKAGKEAANVAAHEIVHSWFGNLVTCKNWTHTWLNEGFTVYCERHIVQQFYGQDVYEEDSYIGGVILEETVKQLSDTPEATKLCVWTNRLCPEFGFTSIAYEKGYLFMKKLELLMGKANLFQFFRIYLSKHQYSSLASEDFIQDFETFAHTLSNGTQILSQLDWHKEMREPGMPSPRIIFSNPKIEAARNLAKEYHDLNGGRPENYKIYRTFNSHLKIIFMIELSKFDTAQKVVSRVDEDQNLTAEERNPEILLFWLKLNIPVRLTPVRELIKEYLGSYGRGKYLYPVYRGLAAADLEYGQSLFKKIGSNYNPKVAEIIRSILHL